MRSWVTLLLFRSAFAAEDNGYCEADGTCIAGEGSFGCGIQGACTMPTSSLYGNGGSAQAYRPDAPFSSTVCDPKLADDYKYRASSWSFTRFGWEKGTAPVLNFKLNLLSCEEQTGDCCCNPIQEESADASSIIEVWQTRPDGTYSNLGSKRTLQPSDNECRAKISPKDGVAVFTTVAPGSTGMMGGIGPSGRDFYPYGPPVIHMLIRMPGHAPVLADFRVLVNPKTLEQRSFFLGDWRPISWMRSRPKGQPLKLKSWIPNTENNSITIEIDVRLHQHPDDAVEFCESLFYGLPDSFYFEPVSVCAPSLLDFFAM
jgi:hypothetical protein